MTYHVTAHPRDCTRPHRLVAAWCVCWGVVLVVDWEIGTECSRCGDTFITEAEYVERRAALLPCARHDAAEATCPIHSPKGQRTSIVRDGRLRPTATMETGGRL